MPNLAQLTDAYYTDPVPAELPVEQPYLGVPADPDGLRRVYINTPSREALPGEVATTGRPEPRPEPGIEENPLEVWAKKKAEGASLWDNLGMAGVEDKSGKSENKLLKKLFGLGGEERYQLWPEKVLREGLAGAGEVMDKGTNLGLRREDVTDIPPPQMPTIDSTRLGKLLGIAPVAASPQDDIIEKAQAISALAGSGGLAGTTDATLGSAPFLRPALKYKDRLYKGKEGQQHMDVIPKELYPEFEKMAMSGEDISHYNFGFINDKGQFLTREKALEYGINTGLIDPHAGKFGALTSTLMADSSKPGTAIEAMAQSRKFDFSKPSAGTNVAKIGDTEIIYGVGKNNDVELTLIKTPKDKRGEGSARAALEQFTKEADEAGKRIMLNADPMDKATSKSGLVDFYKSLGFVRNAGNKRDFSTRAEYIREPVIKADSSKEGAAIQANKPTFYSAVEHNLNTIPQSKMTGDQWLGALSNKPGVKGEELDWTGLKGFLEENKGKTVTKEQIEEHLANNKVELKEIRKGNPPNLKEETDDLYNSLSGTETYPKNAATKYHSYQLPGGEPNSYREMLLTLPAKEKTGGWKVRNNPDVEGEFEVLDSAGKVRYGTTEKEDALKYIKDQNQIDAKQDAYKSSHWDEPNILAHVRMNDRIMKAPDELKALNENAKKALETANDNKTSNIPMSFLIDALEKQGLKNGRDFIISKGSDKKSLHLEEIQSDWHQQGRDKGYKGDLDKATQKWFNHVKKFDELHPDDQAFVKEQLVKNDSGVPDAPFKKSWHELALKRMIREAAEKGYDRLSWTPGEAQAARYDLSKQVDNVKIWPDGNGKYYYEVKKGNKDLGLDGGQAVPADKLKDIVGKELTEKALKDIEGGKPANYSGLDLKIGGEGMKGFYDQIIPKALEKLGKEHGVKVKRGEVQGKINIVNKDGVVVADGFKNKSEAQKWIDGWEEYGRKQGSTTKAADIYKINDTKNNIYYIDIPQSLKNTALQKGFPLFSNGYMLVPVQHIPDFGDDRK